MAEITKVEILNNDSLQPIWAGASPMQVSVRETSKATRFAVEDGSVRNDHVVRNATEIGIKMMLAGDVTNLFEALRTTYQQRDLVTIQTKTAVYTNMLVEEMPHEQDPGMSDAVAVDIWFVEWQEVKPETGAAMTKPKQKNTQQRGTQATKETPPEKRQSVLRSIF